MRLGRGRDVNRVRLGLPEHPGRVREDVGNMETVGELAGHQLVRVACGDDLAAWQELKLGSMLVRDVPAPDDRDPRLVLITHLSDT